MTQIVRPSTKSLRFRRHHAAVLAGAVAVGVLVWLLPLREGARDHLPTPARLPAPARQALSTKMEHHGKAMTELMYKILILDYDGAKTEADHILETPALARPITQDATELNALLPPRFFELQDDVAVRARELREAAERHDAPRVLDAFTALSRACLSCHQVYLAGH